MSSTRTKLLAVVAIASVLGFVSILTWFLGRGPRGLSVVPFPREANSIEILLNVVTFAVPALLISALLALTLRYMRAIVSRCFVLVGAFFAVVMVQAASGLMGPLWSVLVLWLLMCLIVFFTFFSITGFLPEAMDRAVYIAYGAIFGTFFGVHSPTYSLLLFFAVYSVYDIVFARYIAPVMAEAAFESGGERAAMMIGGAKIGLGDVIFYSMVSSHAQWHFGALTSVASAAMILVGSVLSLAMAERYGVFPGLPISMGLSLVPIIAKLVSMT